MKRLRFVTFLVALTVVFAMFSGFTSTEGANQEPEQEMGPVTAQPFVLPDIIEQAEASANGYVGRVTEQENDLYTFVFQNEDGSNTMRVYSDPVKYVDNNGVVRDITTDLEALSDGSFRTADNNVVTTFAKQLSDGITLAYDDIEIKMLPAIPDTASASRFGSAPTASSADGKTVSYAYGNSTTLEYTLTYSGFKEDIVVSEYTGQTEYEFRIETGGLFLTERFGSFYLTDDEGTTCATIGDIIIFTADERNNAFGSLTARTITAGEEYVLTIHIDPAYLRDEATVYPIRIDPTIEIAYDNDGAGAIEDVTINSLQGSDGSSGSLFVGKRDTYGISRVLMRFPGLNLSTILSSSQITDAYVELRDLVCDSTSMTVACGVFTGNAWTEATASWETVAPNNCILMTSNGISYANGIAQETNHRYAFDISSAIEGWIDGYYDQNKGIIFFSNPSVENGTASIHKTFASYNRSSYKPSVVVVYRKPFEGYASDISYYVNSGELTNDDNLQRRANCYGFAFKMFYAPQAIPDDPIVVNGETFDVTNGGVWYKQQPGEFTDKNNIEGISNHGDFYSLHDSTFKSGDCTVDYIFNWLYSDLQAMGYNILSTAKYTSPAQIPSATAYSDRRLIALVVSGYDYHFYMQNSDNTWSHKPGATGATSGCLGFAYSQNGAAAYGSYLCANQTSVLTNANLLTHLQEGYELDYIFFYIDKPATIDYAHLNGCYASCDGTKLYLWDLAGSTENTSAYKIDPTFLYSRIDYKGDIDFYAFSFTSTGERSILLSTYSVGTTLTPYPLIVEIYDSAGTHIVPSTLISDGEETFTFCAYENKTYYIKVSSTEQTTYEFGRRYTITVSSS